MLTPSRIKTPSLSQQIDQARNYHEHRKRVQTTKGFSPFGHLKKSISYDREKFSLHQYFKSRKNYTNSYNRKSTLKSHEQNDAKMLKKILEYDSKQFVFSINNKNERMGSSSLHHNSLVSNYKRSKKIDSDNAKIHFRITKTKSLYSHLFPTKMTWMNTQQIRDSDRYSKIRESKRITQWDIQNVESQEGYPPSKAFQLSSNIKKPSHQQLKLQRDADNNLRLSQTYSKNQRSMVNSVLTNSLTTRKLCERVRRQKLAQNLFEKKQKWQKSILSKLNLKKP